MSLTGKQKRFLRAEAHGLAPVIIIGKEGVTDAVLGAIQRALLDHELIKIRVLEGAPLDRSEVAQALPKALAAELVGQLGRIVILYKRHPEAPSIRLPKGA